MNEPPKIDRQREHQSNERTFLAWLRTAIALIALGFAIARFGIFLRQIQAAFSQNFVPPHPIFNSDNLGIFLILFGLTTVVLAAWNYNQVFWQIEQANYKPNRLLIWIMTVMVVILGLLSIPLIFRRTPPQNLQPDFSKQNQVQQSLPFIANLLIGMKY